MQHEQEKRSYLKRFFREVENALPPPPRMPRIPSAKIVASGPRLNKVDLEIEPAEESFNEESFFDNHIRIASPPPSRTTRRNDKEVRGHPEIRSPDYLGVQPTI